DNRTPEDELQEQVQTKQRRPMTCCADRDEDAGRQVDQKGHRMAHPIADRRKGGAYALGVHLDPPKTRELGAACAFGARLSRRASGAKVKRGPCAERGAQVLVTNGGAELLDETPRGAELALCLTRSLRRLIQRSKLRVNAPLQRSQTAARGGVLCQVR